MASLVAACGGSDRDEDSAAGGPTTAIDPAVFVGQATTVGGETVDLTTLADKDLVVWFWAPW